MRRSGFLLAMGAALGVALAGFATAQDTREAEQKLRKLRAELKSISAERRALEGQRGAAARDLREADEAVGRGTRALAETRDAIVREQGALGSLQQRRAQLEASLAGQREVLARLVRASYMTGSQAPLKVMLAQDQIAKGQRDLAYYGALQRHRAAQIRDITARLQQLAAVETAIGQKQQALKQAQITQQAQLVQVARQKQQREQLLSQIDTKYQDRAGRERALGQDAKALESLLARLRAAAARAERERRAAEARERARVAAEEKRQAAAARRAERTGAPAPARTTPRPRPVVASAPAPQVGGMGWPVSGALLAGFGGRMPDGQASSGLLIGAPAGTSVRAVADGRVVFAEWMSGYGLLCIVDHGNGTMSLYAHNDALLKDVGAAVSRGDAIGTVGNSGGQGQPALYFELRRGGKPVNPVAWLRR